MFSYNLQKRPLPNWLAVVVKLNLEWWCWSLKIDSIFLGILTSTQSASNYSSCYILVLKLINSASILCTRSKCWRILQSQEHWFLCSSSCDKFAVISWNFFLVTKYFQYPFIIVHYRCRQKNLILLLEIHPVSSFLVSHV